MENSGALLLDEVVEEDRGRLPVVVPSAASGGSDDDEVSPPCTARALALEALRWCLRTLCDELTSELGNTVERASRYDTYNALR